QAIHVARRTTVTTVRVLPIGTRGLTGSWRSDPGMRHKRSKRKRQRDPVAPQSRAGSLGSRNDRGHFTERRRMRTSPRRTWAWQILTATLLATTGCYSLQPADHDVVEVCGEICQKSRCRVHIFLVQGCDLLDCANLEGVKEYLQQIGFNRCWF